MHPYAPSLLHLSLTLFCLAALLVKLRNLSKCAKCPSTGSEQRSWVGMWSQKACLRFKLLCEARLWHLPRCRCRSIDQSYGRSRQRFLLKSALTGDDMMETGRLNWLCPPSPLFVPSLSRLPSLRLPAPFFFSSLFLYSSLGCVEHKMSDYFPADSVLCDRGTGAVYFTRWHYTLHPLCHHHFFLTSNIAQAFLITSNSWY